MIFAYKIKLAQELKTLDHQKRHMIVNCAEQQLENDSDFYRKIIVSDEAHFWLNGFTTYSMSHHCTPKKLRFVAVYGPAASLGRTSSVRIKTGTLL